MVTNTGDTHFLVAESQNYCIIQQPASNGSPQLWCARGSVASWSLAWNWHCQSFVVTESQNHCIVQQPAVTVSLQLWCAELSVASWFRPIADLQLKVHHTTAARNRHQQYWHWYWRLPNFKKLK